MGKRIAAIFGANGTSAKKRFKELYDERSDLVHGNVNHLSEETFRLDLRDARRLARDIMIWFLHYLHHVDQQVGARPSAPRPRRNDLLKILDMDPAGRSRMQTLLDILPPSFPYLP